MYDETSYLFSSQGTDEKKQDDTFYLIRNGQSLVCEGYARDPVKLVIFVVLCVLLVGLPLIAYCFLDYRSQKLRTKMLHSECDIRSAKYVVVTEKRRTTRCRLQYIKYYGSKPSIYLMNHIYSNKNSDETFVVLEYKLDKYIVLDKEAVPLKSLGCRESFKSTLEHQVGWTDTPTIQFLQEMFGRNVLDVPLPPLTFFVLKEILTFFYIFQLFSCILWYLNDYEIYATLIIVMSVVSASSTTYLSRRAIVKLRKSVKYECGVMVKREEGFVEVRSGEVVPGDVVKIENSKDQLSFDGILISGNAVVNEAMLTGESVPVLKNPVPLDRLEEPYNGQKDDVYTLYSGTTVLQCRPGKSGEVLAIVTSTGFMTKKGVTVKFMLFPSKQKFKFYSEAYTYVKIMGFIGVLGMIYTIVSGILAKFKAGEIIKGALDLMTIIIAPSLPLALSIAVFYAIRRLKAQKIKCVIPNSINIAGKVKLAVFDKTGTLTEEGLTLHSVVPASSLSDLSSPSPQPSSPPALDVDTRLCLATCHSLSVINNHIRGEPIDEIGQESSGFTFSGTSQYQEHFENEISGTVSTHADGLYGIVRIIPFESHLKRMSVVVEQSYTKRLHVFCKGAPEQVSLHCDPRSLPADFTTALNHFSKMGYRIIGLAGRELSVGEKDVKTVGRDVLEQNLKFYGFLVLSNKLKKLTVPAINELKEADLRVLMCTGDNLLTATSVGRECGMIPENASVYIVKASYDNETRSLKVSYEKDQDKPCSKIQEMTVKVEGPCVENGPEPNRYRGPHRSVHLALDGKTFSLIQAHSSLLMDKIIVTGTIFARFSPDQKMQLVEELQRRDYSVSMCGDGANDCEALQHANVGIAISKCEASLAAPFNSSVFDISCVPILLKEGRGALENSMAVFRFTAMYSLIQYLSVILLVRYNSLLGDLQYLFEDIVMVLLFDFALGDTKPAKKLAVKRPIGSLMHPFLIYSFIVQTCINVCFILLAMYLVQQQPFYDPFRKEVKAALQLGEQYIPLYETTANFTVTCCQYLICALAFSIGHPHRQAVYTNIPMLISTLISMFLLGLVILLPADMVPDLEFADIKSTPFKFALFGLGLANLIIAFGVEYSYRIITPLKKCLKFLRCKKGYKNKFKYIIDELNHGNWPEEELCTLN